MAPLLEDPRIRQTWNQFSQNAESATETAAAGIWTFQHQYINPCLSSVALAFEQCTGTCFPDRDERARRLRERGRTRGRAELSFDFYDDWDEDEGGVLGGWGNDELDRLLAGSGSHSGSKGVDQAPRRKRGMSYGTRSRRKSLEPDPTIIPSTNSLGFLGRLPFKFGGTLRYKPSAADLQEHPGASRSEYFDQEGEPLMPDDDTDDDDDDNHQHDKGHRRKRSSTMSSGETSDSFRSRGDIFPSDGEDDAVPLPDEFAMVLERRGTNSNMDDKSSGRTRSSKGKRPAALKNISRTVSRRAASSQSVLTLGAMNATSEASITDSPGIASPDGIDAPSLSDLQQEEERVRREEDDEVERKRLAAAKLAMKRGLHVEDTTVSMSENKAPIEDSPAVDVAVDDTKDVEYIPSTSREDTKSESSGNHSGSEFVPARLPNFG
ncbi:hypothetical protein HYALB_00001812 [Hymenoscyphus albidus]|uniref:Uncharacterized protein n=1 Tax=Hymenoscyphus albidus TaxID=595503 RepID=A0A9N9LSV3_9HELO|nr:hypothetical protein HYALB_00001812 [Hymenoscyphus albidus]